MRKISKKSRVAIAGAVVVAIAGGGVAYGFWSTSGSGAGSAASSAGLSSLNIEQTSVVTGLGPGMPAGAIAGTVQNTADHTAYVHDVTVSISGVTPAGKDGKCSASDYQITNPTMTVGTELAKNASAAFSGATISFVNDPVNNQDGCKGATVQLAYAAS
jgi:hypothetical protein